MIIDAQNQ